MDAGLCPPWGAAMGGSEVVEVPGYSARDRCKTYADGPAQADRDGGPPEREGAGARLVAGA